MPIKNRMSRRKRGYREGQEKRDEERKEAIGRKKQGRGANVGETIMVTVRR